MGWTLTPHLPLTAIEPVGAEFENCRTSRSFSLEIHGRFALLPGTFSRNDGCELLDRRDNRLDSASWLDESQL